MMLGVGSGIGTGIPSRRWSEAVKKADADPIDPDWAPQSVPHWGNNLERRQRRSVERMSSGGDGDEAEDTGAFPRCRNIPTTQGFPNVIQPLSIFER